MQNENDELISVLIIEDHPIFRDALKGFLETRPDKFELVGDAGLTFEGIQLVNDKLPDIVLLDLGLPEKTDDGIEEGLDLISRIRADSPRTQVVVLTSFTRTDVVFRAIQAGAATYLQKTTVNGQDVINSLLQVHAGHPPFDPEIGRQLWKYIQDPVGEGEALFETLTPRERQVVELIAKNYDNTKIAAELFISSGTVKKHVSNILSKLHMRNRIELQIYYRSQDSAQ